MKKKRNYVSPLWLQGGLDVDDDPIFVIGGSQEWGGKDILDDCAYLDGQNLIWYGDEDFDLEERVIMTCTTSNWGDDNALYTTYDVNGSPIDVGVTFDEAIDYLDFYYCGMGFMNDL